MDIHYSTAHQPVPNEKERLHQHPGIGIFLLLGVGLLVFSLLLVVMGIFVAV